MMIQSFKELAQRAQALPEKTRIALVCAHEKHSLEAIAAARKDGIADGILIGKKDEICILLEQLGESETDYKIIDCTDSIAAIGLAAGAIRDGHAGAIMKGKLETGELMHGILKQENGLRTGRNLSVTGIYSIGTYPKIFGVSDVAITPHPNFEVKKDILCNAVDLFLALGHRRPKVALLAAVERVNSKMIETVEADQLKQMNLRGEIADCVVEGPISFDLATDPKAASIKAYQGAITGDADILIVPDLISGNVLAKCLTGMGKAVTAGLVLGAKVPVILVSRSASATDKYCSIAMAACIAPYFKEKYKKAL